VPGTHRHTKPPSGGATEVTSPHTFTTSTSAPSEVITQPIKNPATGSTSQYAITQNSTFFDTSAFTENNTTRSYDMTYVSTAKHTTRNNISNDAYFSSTGGVTVVITLFALLSLF
jgi:hypothetical protein